MLPEDFFQEKNEESYEMFLCIHFEFATCSKQNWREIPNFALFMFLFIPLKTLGISTSTSSRNPVLKLFFPKMQNSLLTLWLKEKNIFSKPCILAQQILTRRLTWKVFCVDCFFKGLKCLYSQQGFFSYGSSIMC